MYLHYGFSYISSIKPPFLALYQIQIRNFAVFTINKSFKFLNLSINRKKFKQKLKHFIKNIKNSIP